MKILITGVSGGLGSKLAEFLLKKDHNVVGFYNSTDLEKFPWYPHKNFQKEKLDFLLLKNSDSLTSHLPPDVDHVIFCHGMNLSKKILSLEKTDIQFAHQVNFVSTFLISQRVLKDWTASSVKKDRSLLFISSAATQGGSPDEVAYHSSKRAMESSMLSFARAFASDNIRANVISPGLMDTRMGKETITRRPDVLDRIPLRKMVDVQEVVRLIETVITSPSITGQNYHINNGRINSI